MSAYTAALLHFTRHAILAKRDETQKEKTKESMAPHFARVKEQSNNDSVTFHIIELEKKINTLIDEEHLLSQKQQDETDLLLKLQEKIKQTHIEEKIKPFEDFEKIAVKVDQTQQSIEIMKDAVTKIQETEKQEQQDQTLREERIKELEEKISAKQNREKQIKEILTTLEFLEEKIKHVQGKKENVDKIKKMIEKYKKRIGEMKR